MANFRIRYVQQVADIDGQVATTSFEATSPDSTTVAQLITKLNAFGAALAPATNGKVVRTSVSILGMEAQLIPGTPPPTDAIYPSVTDGARINFSNSQGATGHLTIPAPTEGTFLAAPQRDFVDPAGDAAALIAFIQTSATDTGQNYLNLYQGGIKTGRGARRRRPPKAGLT